MKATVEATRRKGIVIFNSIEKTASIVTEFNHPLMEVELLISGERRTRLLGALKKRKTEVDLSLSSENIERLKELINRKSKLYYEAPLRHD